MGRKPQQSVVREESSPWKAEGKEILAGFSGAFIFGVPLLFTMEVWWQGARQRTALHGSRPGRHLFSPDPADPGGRLQKRSFFRLGPGVDRCRRSTGNRRSGGRLEPAAGRLAEFLPRLCAGSGANRPRRGALRPGRRDFELSPAPLRAERSRGGEKRKRKKKRAREAAAPGWAPWPTSGRRRSAPSL